MEHKALEGVVVSVAGMLDKYAQAEAELLVTEHGGRVLPVVTDQVTHVLSSAEMEVVLDNDYKCQFFPTLRPQIEKARELKKPVVSDEFLTKCIAAGKRVKEQPYLLFVVKRVDEGAEFQSTLDPRVQDLVNLLFDENEMERSLTDMNLDAKRLMQVVTSESVKRAYSILGELDGVVRSASSSSAQAQKATQTERIRSLSQQFYGLIPHSGSCPLLSSPESIKEKLKMMEAIGDIEIAARLMKEGQSGASRNAVDVKYRKLRAKLEPVEKHTQEYSYIEQCANPHTCTANNPEHTHIACVFRWVAVMHRASHHRNPPKNGTTTSKQNTLAPPTYCLRYVANTHASAHSNFKLEIETAFRLEREGEKDRFAAYARLPNHRLLWHGSRFTNFIGIITQGLRVAPPEAPVTGYFLGKGVYFADMVSKSAEYCHASKENNTGLLLLCEVALGRWFQLAHGKYISKEDLDEAGFHSTKGCGELAPDPAFDLATPDGYVIPLGHETDTGVLCSELPLNEFVVYDPAQVQVRYLLKVNFEFEREQVRIHY
eukprot:TRINITY_DN2544_c0_g1_i1.p1 TRINITY_DN2544_c0_g1~~TRINITY_DN2544_c0_g1_i1.p1  ORF type:complete len:543 (-),score=145.84 TRINITY_DN2544_c0_g1_i1:66-1694(-)